MDSAIVGEKPRSDSLQETVMILNEMLHPDKIINIWYITDGRSASARFETANYPEVQEYIPYTLETIDANDNAKLKLQFPYVKDETVEARDAFVIKRGSDESPFIQNLGDLFILKKTNIEKRDIICFMRAYRKRVLQLSNIPMFSESIPVIIFETFQEGAKLFVKIYNESFIWRPNIVLIKK
jgi:hypothetical protein